MVTLTRLTNLAVLTRPNFSANAPKSGKKRIINSEKPVEFADNKVALCADGTSLFRLWSIIGSTKFAKDLLD